MIGIVALISGTGGLINRMKKFKELNIVSVLCSNPELKNRLYTPVKPDDIYRLFNDLFTVDPNILICLAGWKHKLTLTNDIRGKVLNIHPSLLPDFGGKGMYGDAVHKAVLESGATETGCTVHWVDDEYDTGDIILQKKVPIVYGDTVESVKRRVQDIEPGTYMEAIMKVDGR